MGNRAVHTGLYSVWQVFEFPAALLPQRIQGTITEQTVKIFRMLCLMAWKKFTFPVLKKFIMLGHFVPRPFHCFVLIWWSCEKTSVT